MGEGKDDCRDGLIRGIDTNSWFLIYVCMCVHMEIHVCIGLCVRVMEACVS